MMKNQTPSITISINIAAADQYEGNAQKVTVTNPSDLTDLTDAELGSTLRELINQASNDFDERNHELMVEISQDISRKVSARIAAYHKYNNPAHLKAAQSEFNRVKHMVLSPWWNQIAAELMGAWGDHQESLS